MQNARVPTGMLLKATRVYINSREFEMYHIVYVTVNSVNLNFYIGKHSTSNLNDGYLGSGYILKRAIKKYGENKFYRLDFCFCNSEAEAFITERKVIEKLQCKDGCYNIGSGGEGGDNISRNPKKTEILQKMSVASKRKWQDAAFREKIHTNRQAAMTTDGHRQLRSELAKHLWEDEKYRSKTISATVASLNTEESKLKRSQIHAALWGNEAYRNKMMGILRSEEHRQTLSEAVKKTNREHPESLLRAAASRSKTMKTPEFRAALASRARRTWETNLELRTMLTEGRMGSQNPSWGSKWMCHRANGLTRKASADQIQSLLNQGWEFGRLKRTGHYTDI